MTRLPEGFPGKILALAMAGALLLAVYLAAVTPLLSLYASEDQRLREREALARHMRADMRDLPLLRRAAREWRERTGAAPFLFDEASDSAAAARLQSALKDLIETQGAKLASSEILAAGPEGKFHQVGLRVAFSGDTEMVANILRRVDDAHPVLAVRALDILHRDDAYGETGMRSVTLDVYGFRAP